MSLAASRGAATVQLPLGQLAVIGLGAVCITNPDKFFDSLSKGLRFVSLVTAGVDPQNSQGSSRSQQPIIIHQASAAPNSTSYRAYVIQLLLSAGLCWGSYVVLVKVLPEQALGMLPVTTSRFNRSVSALGRAVINLKDTLMQQISSLSDKQDELRGKQNETHDEVLNVKDNVEDIRGDLSIVTESLELCHSSLAESERRITYIARGVQLLTRGVSTFLPEDEGLLHELVQFNSAGDDFQQKTPVQQQRLQKSIQAIQEAGRNHHLTLRNLSSDENSADPENEVPSSPPPATVEESVADVHALIAEMTGWNPNKFKKPPAKKTIQ